jgi:hypothetical protein
MKSPKVCGRCGLSEKRGRVFENVSNFHLCIDCAQIAYKAKDSINNGDIAGVTAILSDFKKGVIESSIKLPVLTWIEGYIQTSVHKQIFDLEKVFSDFLLKHETFTNGGLSKEQARLYLDLVGAVEGTSPFEFTGKKIDEARKKYRYIDIAADYWRT